VQQAHAEVALQLCHQFADRAAGHVEAQSGRAKRLQLDNAPERLHRWQGGASHC
jgi:hypothetical protein